MQHELEEDRSKLVGKVKGPFAKISLLKYIDDTVLLLLPLLLCFLLPCCYRRRCACYSLFTSCAYLRQLTATSYIFLPVTTYPSPLTTYCLLLTTCFVFSTMTQASPLLFLHELPAFPERFSMPGYGTCWPQQRGDGTAAGVEPATAY